MALPGFKDKSLSLFRRGFELQEWAQKQSEEERGHAEKFIQHLSSPISMTGCPVVRYINLRGGRYVPSGIPEPIDSSFASALDAMETALKMEINVNHALLKMHKVASDADDAARARGKGVFLVIGPALRLFGVQLPGGAGGESIYVKVKAPGGVDQLDRQGGAKADAYRAWPRRVHGG